jgi:hypothetical protein
VHARQFFVSEFSLCSKFRPIKQHGRKAIAWSKNFKACRQSAATIVDIVQQNFLPHGFNKSKSIVPDRRSATSVTCGQVVNSVDPFQVQFERDTRRGKESPINHETDIVKASPSHKGQEACNFVPVVVSLGTRLNFARISSISFRWS